MSSDAISSRIIKEPILNTRNYLHWMRNYELSAPSEFDSAGEYLQIKILPDFMTKDFKTLNPAFANVNQNKSSFDVLLATETLKIYMKDRKDFESKSKRLIADIIAHMNDDALFTLKQNDTLFKSHVKNNDVVEFAKYIKKIFSSQESNTLWDDIETAKAQWKSYKQFDGTTHIPFNEFNLSWKEKLDALQDLCDPNFIPLNETLNVYIKSLWAEGISQPLADLRQLILCNDPSAPKSWESTKLKVKSIINNFEAISGKRNPPVNEDDQNAPPSPTPPTSMLINANRNPKQRDLLTTPSSNRRESIRCIFCEEYHTSNSCEKLNLFIQENQDDINEFLSSFDNKEKRQGNFQTLKSTNKRKKSKKC